METRTEYDSIGSLEVPANAYYGVQTLRAKTNFNITGHVLNKELVISLVQIKKAAAMANFNAGELSCEIANAIAEACDFIIAGGLDDHFIVDAIQGGAGTSANMNANEVIANKALEIMGYHKGQYEILHPNDHVNLSQSTNDVFPTAGRIALIRLLSRAIVQLERLSGALEQKSVEFSDIIKMGRTQLQDAVPISLGQSFGAYRCAIDRDIRRFRAAQDELKIVNIGGTAIGTCINASKSYFENITRCICDVTGIEMIQASNLIDATQNLDGFVYVSGIIKACAVNLSKMANDLRFLSSGPKAGINELHLPPMQNGSSIMPGKVNPVIPEVVSQVAFNIIGNDTTITMAAEAGQLELNAFEPVLFYKLFESIETLEKATFTFVDNCISGISANKQTCQNFLNSSIGTVTALCPNIGYKKAADIAKRSLKTGNSIRNIVLEENILSQEEVNVILNPAALIRPSYCKMKR